MKKNSLPPAPLLFRCAHGNSRWNWEVIDWCRARRQEMCGNIQLLHTIDHDVGFALSLTCERYRLRLTSHKWSPLKWSGELCTAVFKSYPEIKLQTLFNQHRMYESFYSFPPVFFFSVWFPQTESGPQVFGVKSLSGSTVCLVGHKGWSKFHRNQLKEEAPETGWKMSESCQLPADNRLRDSLVSLNLTVLTNVPQYVPLKRLREISNKLKVCIGIFRISVFERVSFSSALHFLIPALISV